jgi:hypothetical protein
MQNFYNNADDFFGQFEADTFDAEIQEGNTFKGYVKEDDKLILAATFEYADNDSGYGWVDQTVV